MCCTEDKTVPPTPRTKEQIDALMSLLPQAVLSPVAKGNPLSGLGLVMPTDGKAVPKVHEDGSIEYERIGDPPPNINGYQRSEENSWLFKPLWPICHMRMQGTKRDRKTGAIDVVMVCNHPQAKDHFQRFVKHTDCEGCPLRPKQ